MKTVLEFLKERNYSMTINDNKAIIFDRHGEECIWVDIRYNLVQMLGEYKVNVSVLSELCSLLENKLTK